MPSMSKEKPTPFQLFHLSTEDNGQTLGASIKRRMEGWSWGQTREAILKRRVQVNGNLCLDQARKVTEKDVIKLWNESLPKPVQPSNVKIVYVDESESNCSQHWKSFYLSRWKLIFNLDRSP